MAKRRVEEVVGGKKKEVKKSGRQACFGRIRIRNGKRGLGGRCLKKGAEG